jgi:hypothetical protein
LGINPRKTNQYYEQDPVVIFEWLELLMDAMAKVGLDMTVASNFRPQGEMRGKPRFCTLVGVFFTSNAHRTNWLKTDLVTGVAKRKFFSLS